MLKKTLLALLMLPSLLIAQQSIKGTFSPAGEYEWAILYRVSPSLMYYTVDTQVANDGTFELKLDSTMTKGAYRIVYGVPQETFNFDLVYNGEEDIELKFDTNDGLSFVSSEENILWNNFLEEEKLFENQLGEVFKNGDSKSLKKVFKARQELQDKYEQDATGMLVSHFIKASRTYIPKNSESLAVYSKNWMDSYFSNIDVTNPVLQNSSFILDKAYKYIKIFGFESSEETITAVVDFLKSGDQKLQKGVQYGIWQNLVEANNLEAANYLAESALIPLAKSLKDEILAETLIVFKNTTIGTIPPNFSWKIEKDEKTISQDLHGLDEAENYILVFWSSSCSHCLKEIPKLHEFVKKQEEGKYKVIAIGLEDEPAQWKSETYYYPLFTHVLGLGKWENKIGNDYGVSATPGYFILDKDKKIIHKPEELVDLIEVLK